MITPAGKECRYYYEDFHRGRSRQECRLVGKKQGARAWRPGDCARCPVPAILLANASPYLELRAEVLPGFLGLGREIRVTAHCRKHNAPIADPYYGCEACAAEHPGLLDFINGTDSP